MDELPSPPLSNRVRTRKVCAVCKHSYKSPSKRLELKRNFREKYKERYTFKLCKECHNIIGKTEYRRTKSKTPIPAPLLNQWVRMFNGTRDAVSIKEYVVMLYCYRPLYSDWLYIMITSIYKTRKEWINLINQLRRKSKVIDPNSSTPSLNNLNPFFHSGYIANHINKLVLFNIKLKHLILKCVQRRLLAKMDANVVGENDLYTTIPIPAQSLVSVYDFKTKRKYLFHTNTILRTIIASLKYSAYGIAKPMPPKNPYTNMDWTHEQLMSITQQIVHNMANIYRIPPALFLNYYHCAFNLGAFAKFCEKELYVNAAKDMFSLRDDTDTRNIYAEVIDDMLKELDIYMSVSIHNMIINRKLPENLQAQWDNVVLSIWIYTNIDVIHEPYRTYGEITDDFIRIFDDTRTYLSELVHRRSPSRGATLARTQAILNLIDTVIYAENTLEYPVAGM